MAKNGNAGLFGNLNLPTKIGLGFGLMILLLVAAISFTQLQMAQVDKLAGRVVELRTPTAQASLGMLNGLNQSLSGLRGWMLLGNPRFKEERALAWSSWLDPKLDELRGFSKNWTNPENARRLRIIETLITDFRRYQQEIEDIANTIDATPAQKMLLEDAAPRAGQLAALITQMINIEGQQEATLVRKNILFAMADVRGSLGLGLANIRAFLLAGEQRFQDDFEKLWATNTRRFNDLSGLKHHLTAEQRVAFERFVEVRAEFEKYPPQMFKIKASDEANLANYWLATRAAPAAAKIVVELEDMVENQRELLITDGEAMSTLIQDLEFFEWVLLAGGVFIALVFATVLTRAIAGPIVEMADTVRQIAERRDLTITVAEGGDDEIGRMSAAFNSMMDVLRGAFTVVSNSAVEVADSSQDVAQRADGNRNRAREEMKRAETSEKVITEMGNTAGQVSEAATSQQLAAQATQGLLSALVDRMKVVSESAQGQNAEANKTMERVSEMGATGAKVVATAEQQGQMVEKVTDSINSMVNAVQNMQAAVGQAQEHGKASLDAAEQGHDSVAQTVRGMQAISESSEQISEIIDVITEIAEQTNLLALNAAVEAARAGMHGKGFAVVADEVGKLAQRSSEAAKEITQLIKDSTGNVAEGVKLTDQSQQALARIADGGRVNMQAIEAISNTAEVLNTSTTEVKSQAETLNTLAHEIASMAGEQGARRKAAEEALQILLEYSNSITDLVNESNSSIHDMNKEMDGVVKRGEEMSELTGLQAQRSKAITKISNESATAASQTVEGAGVVVSITEKLQDQSVSLTEQVKQFRF
ncbi:MAG: HAMP domain-containing protein [Gammaproteobacteria bacterium]|nr:HAMP domain-containing protein [Gammaproteobacteria bacterium]